MEDAITLKCDHRFCAMSLAADLTIKINEAKTGEDALFCPFDKQPIEFAIISNILDKETIEKYDRFMLKSLFSNDKDENDAKVECPKCEYLFFNEITENFKTLKKHTCFKCKLEFCPHCSE